MTIKEIRSLTGLSQAKFSEQYGVPKRTVENWESGINTPPAYVVELLEYKVKNELKEANIMKNIAVYSANLTAASVSGEYQLTEANLDKVVIEGNPVLILREYVDEMVDDSKEPEKLSIVTETGNIHNLPAGVIVVALNEEPTWIFWTEDGSDDPEVIAALIRNSDQWQLDLGDDSPERQLCKLAGLEDEFEAADADTFESVIYKAAEMLGVEI